MTGRDQLAQRGQSHFRGERDGLQRNALRAAKIGTVPVNSYGRDRRSRLYGTRPGLAHSGKYRV